MEKEIVAKFMKGDTQTLEWMYSNFGPSVFGFILKNGGNEEDAKDIFQTTILEVYSNITDGKYNERNKFKQYFVKVGMNKWRKEQARRKKIKKRPIDENSLSIEDTSSERFLQTILKNKRIDAIEIAFNTLHASCKELIKARYFHRIKLKDIAAERGEKGSKVRVELMRCREKIGKWLVINNVE